MSLQLLDFTKSYLKGHLKVTSFVDGYIELWKIEGKMGLLAKDPKELSEFLSTTFCQVDLFNPDDDRLEYELDEDALRRHIKLGIKTLSSPT